MGIPQSDTDQTNVVIPWTLGGQDHISSIVTKGALPAVDAEDDKGWDVMKYEKQELSDMVFADGVFIGDVWRDGVDRDSFAVSYGGGNIAVVAGRAIVGKKRIDLGLGGTYDGDFTAAFVLPTAGNYKIIYLDIFERAVTPTAAFTPAGVGYDISVYADFTETYNTTDCPIKEAAGSVLPAAGAGHTFLALAVIDDAGNAVDKRVLSFIKNLKDTRIKGFVVDVNGTIGVNCTHTVLNNAYTDTCAPQRLGESLNYITDKMIIYVKPGSYTFSGAFAASVTTAIIGCHEGTFNAINSGLAAGFVLDTYPQITLSGLTLTTRILAVSNCYFISVDGSTELFATKYFDCLLSDFNSTIELDGEYVNCYVEIDEVVNTSSVASFRDCYIVPNHGSNVSVIDTNCIFVDSTIVISGGTAAGPIYYGLEIGSNSIVQFQNCDFQLRDAAASGGILEERILKIVDTAAPIFDDCRFSYYQEIGTCTTIYPIYISSTVKSIFKNCSYKIDSAYTATNIVSYIHVIGGGIASLFNCKYLSSDAEQFLLITQGTVEIIGGDYQNTNTSGTTTMIYVNTNTVATSFSIIGANIIKAKGHTLDINALVTTITFILKNSYVEQQNAAYLACQVTGTIAFEARDTTLENIAAGGALSVVSATSTRLYGLNCISNGGSGLTTAIAINLTSSTYTGAQAGAGSINGQVAGGGANTANVQV